MKFIAINQVTHALYQKKIYIHKHQESRGRKIECNFTLYYRIIEFLFIWIFKLKKIFPADIRNFLPHFFVMTQAVLRRKKREKSAKKSISKIHYLSFVLLCVSLFWMIEWRKLNNQSGNLNRRRIKDEANFLIFSQGEREQREFLMETMIFLWEENLLFGVLCSNKSGNYFWIIILMLTRSVG